MLEQLLNPDGGLGLSELSSKVVLPFSEEEFFAKHGPLPGMSDDLRRFQRRYLRGKAPFQLMSSLPAFHRDSPACLIYTRDVSIGGLGFMMHEQLYPTERALVRLPSLGERLIAITSCRYVGPNCYETGATFLAANPPA